MWGLSKRTKNSREVWISSSFQIVSPEVVRKAEWAVYQSKEQPESGAMRICIDRSVVVTE